jgi:glucose-6-phosphate 1-dehydrogenase
MELQPIEQSLTLFLIGATGDLARKKVLKALFELFRQGLLPKRFTLIANSRKAFSDSEFRAFVREAVQPENAAQWQAFSKTIRYVAGDVTEQSTFEAIKALHGTIKDCGNHLWYLATLPSLYTEVIRHLGELGMSSSDCGWTKVMLEKPFGTDLATAIELNQFLKTIFKEDQIYRIDHFLAKETVQNLLAFRFANGIFEQLWNKDHVDHIQVLASETLGLAGRGSFYEGVGTVRDVVQNHVLQLIAMTMMEEPSSLSADAVNKERNDLLDSLKLPDHIDIFQVARFGQYQGYIKDANLPIIESRTETAVALALTVQNDRWRGVPILIRAGKRLKQTTTEISIQFKEPVNSMFKKGAQRPNVLTLRIAPNEGVEVRFLVKRPGLRLALDEVPMQFCYKNEFEMGLVEAYVKLIYSAIQGDGSLFPDNRGIESAWGVIEPLLEYKRTPDFILDTYKPDSWGPYSFDKLASEFGTAWIEPNDMFCSVK